ncbi:hypothetical protein CROQUDRAFT_94427 [Cronartium quercuum f. sp. fusiforme G11]|uniref:Uncharacterized protein n=1 Tax=Cronartium quercuum f. sp. fusiforme G11 TaxID=708437 RepID=A0A9P6TAT7_9BASI|nr:hypothetical protein CROQUDRAFT_94427 [Cronartium quercuum f. sp. fusiforme G11]
MSVFGSSHQTQNPTLPDFNFNTSQLQPVWQPFFSVRTITAWSAICRIGSLLRPSSPRLIPTQLADHATQALLRIWNLHECETATKVLADRLADCWFYGLPSAVSHPATSLDSSRWLLGLLESLDFLTRAQQLYLRHQRYIISNRAQVALQSVYNTLSPTGPLNHLRCLAIILLHRLGAAEPALVLHSLPPGGQPVYASAAVEHLFKTLLADNHPSIALEDVLSSEAWDDQPGCSSSEPTPSILSLCDQSARPAEAQLQTTVTSTFFETQHKPSSSSIPMDFSSRSLNPQSGPLSSLTPLDSPAQASSSQSPLGSQTKPSQLRANTLAHLNIHASQSSQHQPQALVSQSPQDNFPESKYELPTRLPMGSLEPDTSSDSDSDWDPLTLIPGNKSTALPSIRDAMADVEEAPALANVLPQAGLESSTCEGDLMPFTQNLPENASTLFPVTGVQQTPHLVVKQTSVYSASPPLVRTPLRSDVTQVGGTDRTDQLKPPGSATIRTSGYVDLDPRPSDEPRPLSSHDQTSERQVMLRDNLHPPLYDGRSHDISRIQKRRRVETIESDITDPVTCPVKSHRTDELESTRGEAQMPDSHDEYLELAASNSEPASELSSGGHEPSSTRRPIFTDGKDAPTKAGRGQPPKIQSRGAVLAADAISISHLRSSKFNDGGDEDDKIAASVRVTRSSSMHSRVEPRNDQDQRRPDPVFGRPSGGEQLPVLTRRGQTAKSLVARLTRKRKAKVETAPPSSMMSGSRQDSEPLTESKPARLTRATRRVAQALQHGQSSAPATSLTRVTRTRSGKTAKPSVARLTREKKEMVETEPPSLTTSSSKQDSEPLTESRAVRLTRATRRAGQAPQHGQSSAPATSLTRVTRTQSRKTAKPPVARLTREKKEKVESAPPSLTTSSSKQDSEPLAKSKPVRLTRATRRIGQALQHGQSSAKTTSLTQVTRCKKDRH